MSSQLIDGIDIFDSERIKELIRNNEFVKSKTILLQVLNIIESYALETGEGVTSGYYEKLFTVYNKLKDKKSAKNILLRYLIQPKARGKSARKIYERYLKLNPTLDESAVQKDIYDKYLANLDKTNLIGTRIECEHCHKLGIYLLPKNYIHGSMFIAICPFCFEETLVGLK